MSTAAPPRSSSRSGLSFRARLGVASRAIAALGGGYAVTSLLATAIALLAREAPREEAILRGTTAAFLVFAACILWAFAASTATRAWLGLGLPGLALGLLVWRLQLAS